MKRMSAIGAILSIAAALAGCGGGTDHNAQDVTFAKDMVPHHEQAVVMSDLALAQAGSPEVKDLATRIKAAQAPEISTMKGWLTDWNAKPTDMGGMGSMSMNGMVSDDGLQKLKGASGSQFDRMFLEDMTGHHKGAVEMAKAELDKGKFPAAQKLARDITTSQEKEIGEMSQLLGRVPA